jgi:predicted amidohydrolase
LLIYVASWPKTRINAWDILIRARAIENLSYAVAVNRTGEDENGYSYVGHSQVVDYLGDYLVEPTEQNGVFITTLDKSKVIAIREKLNFLSDKDTFDIKN